MILSNIKSRKIKNIERNSSVSVLVDTPNPLRGILIYGTARIDYDNVYDQAPAIMETSHPIHGMSREKLQHFTKAYLDTFKTVVVRVTPKHITTFDYTKDEIWNNFLNSLPSCTEAKTEDRIERNLREILPQAFWRLQANQ